MEDLSKQSSDDHRHHDDDGGDDRGDSGHEGEHRKQKKKSSKKKKKRDKEKRSRSKSDNTDPNSYEERIQAKQRAAGLGGSTASAKSGGSGAKSIAEHASALDARIEAKRAANAPPVNRSHMELSAGSQGSSGFPPCGNRGIDEEEGINNGEEEVFLLADKSDHEKEGGERNTIGTDEGESFQEQGVIPEEEEHYYPNVQADIAVMEEIHQEGLVDEAGGIQAYVAEPEIISGDVIGVIKSDEEVEREERRTYTKYFLAASACLIFLIIIIGVPVTLKATNVIGKTVVLTDEPTASPTCMPSDAPSWAPTSDYFTQVIEKLMPLSGEALLDPQTPQYKAARWISDVDQMDVNAPGFEQRYTMAVFYYSTNGENWNTQTGWLGKDSECTWHGVKGLSNCLDGCTSNGDICGITMKYNRINGPLPSELGILTEMRYFEIQNNGLDGTIPSEIGNWSKLTAFLVNWNRLEGPFPSFVENNKLGTIFVNGNRLTGDYFVDSISRLANLEWIEAQENKFSGSITNEITSLIRLEQFDVRGNNLTGTLPNNWNENHRIWSLMVSKNNITGPLPGTLGNIPLLKKLHTSENSLIGSIPTSFYNLSRLEELYLDGNGFVGGLPQSAEPFYENMEEFSIHGNNFDGRFPSENFESYKLRLLSLHNNHLTGTITEAICARTDSSQANSIKTLTADCDLVMCDCCTQCY